MNEDVRSLHERPRAFGCPACRSATERALTDAVRERRCLRLGEDVFVSDRKKWAQIGAYR